MSLLYVILWVVWIFGGFVWGAMTLGTPTDFYNLSIRQRIFLVVVSGPFFSFTIVIALVGTVLFNYINKIFDNLK